jgi:hypothetical protein
MNLVYIIGSPNLNRNNKKIYKYGYFSSVPRKLLHRYVSVYGEIDYLFIRIFSDQVKAEQFIKNFQKNSNHPEYFVYPGKNSREFLTEEGKRFFENMLDHMGRKPTEEEMNISVKTGKKAIQKDNLYVYTDGAYLEFENSSSFLNYYNILDEFSREKLTSSISHQRENDFIFLYWSNEIMEKVWIVSRKKPVFCFSPIPKTREEISNFQKSLNLILKPEGFPVVIPKWKKVDSIKTVA